MGRRVIQVLQERKPQICMYPVTRPADNPNHIQEQTLRRWTIAPAHRPNKRDLRDVLIAPNKTVLLKNTTLFIKHRTALLLLTQLLPLYAYSPHP